MKKQLGKIKTPKGEKLMRVEIQYRHTTDGNNLCRETLQFSWEEAPLNPES